MKSDKSTWIIIIVIFILIGLAYEPLKNQSANLNKQNSPDPNYSSTITDEDNYNNSNVETSSDIKEIERNIARLEKEVEKKKEESIKSPYSDKVTMSYINNLNDPSPDREYITLYTNLEKNEKVNITGWYLKSEVTGKFVVIGRATLLPFPFAKSDSDIILQHNDRIVLTKGFSPIGISFRTNKCTGFFEENRSFTPYLSQVCPAPKDEDLPRFSSLEERNDECIELIEQLPRCATVKTSFLRDLPDTVTSACKNYMKTQINYNTCVAKHIGDTNFPGNEYRYYFNKFGELWKNKREKVVLYDTNGLIVATNSY